MGRQAYMTRLALGRSAYQPPLETFDPETTAIEPENEDQNHEENPATLPTATERPEFHQQLYDSKGHPRNPASKELGRQSRRAQNYVLEKAGVCYRVGSDGQPRAVSLHQLASHSSKIDNIRKENDVGLLVSSADFALMTLSGMFAVGIRHRLQTFRFYSGIPSTGIVGSELKYFGMLKYFLAGTMAVSLHYVLKGATSWAIEELCDRLVERIGRQFEYFESPKAQRRLFFIMWNVERLLEVTSFVVLAPLQVYAELQRLDLVPFWPMFPPARSLIPFSPSSPLQLPRLPDNITLSSCAGFLAQLAVSPVFLWWAINWAKPPIRQKIYKYLRAALPKPQIPDKDSLVAASRDDLHSDSVPGLCNAIDNTEEERESSSVLEELGKDLQFIGRTYQRLYDKVSWTWRRSLQAGNLVDPQESEPLADREQRQPLNIDLAIPSEPLAQRQPGTFFDIDTLPTEGILLPDRPRSLSMGPPVIPASSIAPFPEPNPDFPSRPSTSQAQVQLDTPTASPDTDAFPANITFPAPSPTLNDEPATNDNADNSRRTSENSVPEISTYQLHTFHRLTALSAYPADGLATHLSSHIADILFFPLEALFIRSVALAFLSSPAASAGAQAAAARWRGQIYPLGGWFGMGLRAGRRGMGNYVGKMVLVSGLEVGFGMAVWQTFTGFNWWVGRRFYAWGRLWLGEVVGVQVGNNNGSIYS